MKTTYLVAAIVIVIVAIAAIYFMLPKASIDVSSILVSSDFVRIGEKFNATVSVKNSGSASGSYTLQLKAGSTPLVTKDITLDAGAVADYVFPLILNDTGSTNLVAGSVTRAVRVIKPIFADKRIREALAYAFDYQTFIDDIMKGGAIIPNGAVPQGMFGYDPTVPTFTYNLTKAKELLQTAASDYGYSTETPLKITLYYNEGNAEREKGVLLLASAIQSLNVGIQCNVQTLAWPQYLAMLRAKALPLFFLGWAPDFVDADDYLVPFLHSVKGTFPIRTGYENPEVDRLIDLQSTISDPVERQKVITQIHMLVYNDVPFIWEDQPQAIHFQRSWIQGWYYNPAFSNIYYPTISKKAGAMNPDVITTESIGEPDYVDPAVDYETGGGEIIQNVYETLFWFKGGDATTVIPWLAESYEVSADGLTYTIKIRKGINFHDGTPLNAEAVKYSIERAVIIADPDGPAWMLDVIKGAGDLMNKIWEGNATEADVTAWQAQEPIEVIDDSTVKINLARAYAPFTKVLAYTVCAIMSPTYVEANGGVTVGEHNEWMDRHAEAGTGPYILESWEAGVLTMKKNPNYWGGPSGDIHPTVERVIIKTVTDANTRLLDLKGGDTDFAYIIRDHWFQLIDESAWKADKTVQSIVEGIDASGPWPTFDIGFLGINYRY